MKRKVGVKWWGPLLGAIALALVACYELVSVTTVVSDAPTWTGASSIMDGSINRWAVGIAGDELHLSRPGDYKVVPVSALVEFGGPFEITSVAQTNPVGHHEGNFVHGNLVAHTDNLKLLYSISDFHTFEWFHPSWAKFWDGNEYFSIVEICELAASTRFLEETTPGSVDNHVFLSVRACGDETGICAGGVVETWLYEATGAGDNLWWIESNQEGVQATVRKADGTRFSNECMPISVTGWAGTGTAPDQERQYLVVGDPSWDELSVFDAFRLWEGPIDTLRVPDASRSIADVVIEGRREPAYDLPMLAVLWSGASTATIEHFALADGVFPSSPHLTESVPADVRFISSRGTGAAGTTGHLYTYGDRLRQRAYQED